MYAWKKEGTRRNTLGFNCTVFLLHEFVIAAEKHRFKMSTVGFGSLPAVRRRWSVDIQMARVTLFHLSPLSFCHKTSAYILHFVLNHNCSTEELGWKGGVGQGCTFQNQAAIVKTCASLD